MISVLHKKLAYRSAHRGTKEADLFFMSFFDIYSQNASDAWLSDYAWLMDQSDAVLFDWIGSKKNIDLPLKTGLLSDLKAWWKQGDVVVKK
jgi:antitoxin CptB